MPCASTGNALSVRVPCAVPLTSRSAGTPRASHFLRPCTFRGAARRPPCESRALRYGAIHPPPRCSKTVHCAPTCNALSDHVPCAVPRTSRSVGTPTHHTYCVPVPFAAQPDTLLAKQEPQGTPRVSLRRGAPKQCLAHPLATHYPPRTLRRTPYF